MVNESDLRLDYLVDPSIQLYQDPNHFCLNTDTRLLAQFMRIKKGESVLDIGTNNAALLVYASRFSCSKLIGVEVLPESFEVAQLNVRRFIDGEVELINAPIQRVEHEPVDVVVSNPPFFELKEMHPDTRLDLRAKGRFELNCTLEELVASAGRLLKSNGRVYLVHPPHRIFEIFAALHACRFSVKRMQVAYDRRSKGAKSLLIEAIKEGHTKTTIEDSLWI